MGIKVYHHYSIQKKSQIPLERTTPKDHRFKNPASISSCLTTNSHKNPASISSCLTTTSHKNLSQNDHYLLYKV